MDGHGQKILPKPERAHLVLVPPGAHCWDAPSADTERRGGTGTGVHVSVALRDGALGRVFLGVE